jgi:hypothetical protein
VQDYLAALAERKGVALSDLANDLLKKDIAILERRSKELDKSIFTISQALFFALVDDARVGADGKLHHLVLTKKDRRGRRAAFIFLGSYTRSLLLARRRLNET